LGMGVLKWVGADVICDRPERFKRKAHKRKRSDCRYSDV